MDMDALQLLEQDHRAVDALFEKLEGTYAKPANPGRASATRAEALLRLNEALTAHALMEERVFYKALEDVPETRDLIISAYREHEDMKRLLRELSQQDLQTEVFATLAEELKRTVQHHVQEEEETLFPRVRELLSASQLEELGGHQQRERAEIEKTELAQPRRGAELHTADGAPARPGDEPDLYDAGSQRDARVRKEHRESPGSRDTGRKGGASTTEKETPRAGRSSH
jgi:hemerythrin superfamily protein